MPAAAREESIETAVNDENAEWERPCPYTPEELAAAAGNAAELQLLGEESSAGELKVRVLRYIGGTHALQDGENLKLEMMRSKDASRVLEKARASNGKIVLLYPSASYGEIFTYAQCGLLPDDAFETVSQNFELKSQ